MASKLLHPVVTTIEYTPGQTDFWGQMPLAVAPSNALALLSRPNLAGSPEEGELTPGTFHGKDFIPNGTFHGEDEIPPGTFH